MLRQQRDLGRCGAVGMGGDVAATGLAVAPHGPDPLPAALPRVRELGTNRGENCASLTPSIQLGHFVEKFSVGLPTGIRDALRPSTQEFGEITIFVQPLRELHVEYHFGFI
jgi:hypothetical protein